MTPSEVNAWDSRPLLSLLVNNTNDAKYLDKDLCHHLLVRAPANPGTKL